MILTFHKVSAISKTFWWVDNDNFWRILNELVDKEFVYLDDYDPKNEKHVVITFDGPYSVILEFAAPELYRRSVPFEVYVIGDYIGQNNEFDSVEPLTNFCSLAELEKLVELGGRLQWHTRTHQLGKNPSSETILAEFTVPTHLKKKFPNHFKHFAYPHGSASVEMRRIAETLFHSAASVDEGDPNDVFYLPRITVKPNHVFNKFDLTVIIVNHNYGHLISECLESVRRQTLMPCEIHVVDDFSTDGSQDFLPTLVRGEKLFMNEKNLGIVDNFNLAMTRVTTEFCMFLGADNYLHPRAIELLGRAFVENPKTDIVYFDMMIVGPLAAELANKVNAKKVGKSIRDNLDLFLWEVADFTEESAKILKFSNFINGSSVFRKEVFSKIGGYKKTYPEDHKLWVRMVESGSIATRVPMPLLYYRQHSVSQANTALSALLELKYLRNRITELENSKSVNFLPNQELEIPNQELEIAYQELVKSFNLILNSTIWRATKPIRSALTQIKKLSRK
jgi:GT2 family glycosyltransferase